MVLALVLVVVDALVNRDFVDVLFGFYDFMTLTRCNISCASWRHTDAALAVLFVDALPETSLLTLCATQPCTVNGPK